MNEHQLFDECLKRGAYIDGGINHDSDALPRNYDGFELTIEKCRDFYVPLLRENAKEVVSMALFSRPSALTIQYVNKLPIMMMNKKRLNYTAEAFAFKYEHQNVACLAVEFILQNDIASISHIEAPNERFSTLLHTLKSDGYENFIVSLARQLKFNINLMKSKGLVYKYTNAKHTGWINCAHQFGWSVSFNDASVF